VRYLVDKAILPTSQTAARPTARIVPKICQSQPPIIYL